MRRSGLATTSGSAGTGPGNDTGVWLIMTIILFALLCNYSRTICLIDVGTEGITLDPDEQVQQVVRLIFRKFDELGTLHAVLQYLVRHEITLGVRERCGEAKGHLVWRRPNRMTLQNLLHHPMYAGAYCYGRRQIDQRRKHPGRGSPGRVGAPPGGG